MSLLSASARRTLAAGGAVLVLGGSAVGIAAAQTAPTPTPAARTGQANNGPQAFVDALAKRLNISSANLQSAIDQARTDVGAPAGGGFGHRGPGGPGGFGQDLNTAAQAIGITADQLRTELPGKSLTQVAQAHGKDPAAVATALKNAAHTRIDKEVTDGHLTADQATTRKTQVDTRIDQQMTQVGPQGGQAGGPGGPGGGPGGRGGFGQDLGTAATAIGITADQLRTELPAKSLTQVAQAHGKDPAAVATALKNAAHTRIDKEVTDGHLTTDQATTRKTQVDTRIDQQMTQTVPQRQPAAQ